MTKGTKSLRRQKLSLLYKIERYSYVPFMILALTMIPLLVGPLAWGLSASEMRIFTTLGIVIWALFAIELAVKVWIVQDKRTYLRKNWLQVIVVLLPFLRPIRLIGVLLFTIRVTRGMREVFGFGNMLIIASGLILISATVMISIERGSNDDFNSFGDALWWSLVTVSTVGYGDTVPSTIIGRLIAVFVMVSGIAVFGAIAGNLSSFLTRRDDIPSRKREMLVIDELRMEIRSLREEIKALAKKEQAG